MLSLAELRHATRALDATLTGARLQRVVQADAALVVLTFYGREETNVLLHCGSDFARLSIVDQAPPAPPSPPAFAQYLRAHLRGARFVSAGLLGGDRQAVMRLETAEGAFDLVLSLLGARSNVVLLDAAGLVRASLRPLADTRRDLSLGQPWSSPSTAPPRAGEDRWVEVGDEDYLAAIEATYQDREEDQARDELLRRLGQSIRKELQYLERREEKIAADLLAATAATGARAQGELLKSVLHTVPAGATRVVATDYASGEEVSIALDPLLSPAANLEKLFARYQKAQKGVRVLGQQLADVRLRREKVAALAEQLRALGDRPGLEALRAQAARASMRAVLERHYPRRGERGARGRDGGAASRAKPGAAKSTIPARLLPKVYVTDGDLEIWVGRSDEGNDYLTTRLARGNDLFFHVEGVGGSHVILRTGGRKDPPAAAILDACEVAVHFSKARDEQRADVHVAAIKDVKKPRHAKPGLVHVLRGRTIHLRRDPARLQKVLGDRR
jgi:predicted ribosome quality control (RQC) complex YloA/Tae2 family protein